MAQWVIDLASLCGGPGSIPSLVQQVKGFGIAAAVGIVAAVACIQSQPWELPYAVGVAKKEKIDEAQKV